MRVSSLRCRQDARGRRSREWGGSARCYPVRTHSFIMTVMPYHGSRCREGVEVSETHNVFVSHRHEDDALVAAFKGLLAGRNVDIRDSSITTDNPNSAENEAYIKY